MPRSSSLIRRGRLDVKYKGVIPGQMQPNAELEYQEDGRIQGHFDTECDTTILSRGLPLEAYMFSPHPDDPRCSCYNIKSLGKVLDKTRLTFSYVGVWKSPTDWFIDFQGSLSQEPIETHKDFISKIGGTRDNPLNGAVFDQETGEFIGFPVDAQNELGGVSSYYVPSVVSVFSRWSRSKPASGSRMGRISRPPDFIGIQGIDYLVGPVTYRQIGPLYQESIAYLGSGPRGWNKIIYGS